MSQIYLCQDFKQIGNDVCREDVFFSHLEYVSHCYISSFLQAVEAAGYGYRAFTNGGIVKPAIFSQSVTLPMGSHFFAISYGESRGDGCLYNETMLLRFKPSFGTMALYKTTTLAGIIA